MDYMPLIMMGLMGLAAGWIANQLVNRGHGDLISMTLAGVAGAFVGGYIQRYAKLDFMQLGNPLLEQLAISTIGAVAVIVVARAIAKPSN
jgi:uncharacterized membrane protein YeaQ/YmgE (transglycosylase-associated protein family)